MDHMASSDTPDSRLDTEENPTSASFMPKKSGDELEGTENTIHWTMSKTLPI